MTKTGWRFIEFANFEIEKYHYHHHHRFSLALSFGGFNSDEWGEELQMQFSDWVDNNKTAGGGGGAAKVGLNSCATIKNLDTKIREKN
jgi:hypothetical protein